MGEYFDWVNVDRKEYISPSEFGLGNKGHETVWKENNLLRAVRDLLSNEWKGCRIMFLGDECEAPSHIATALFQKLQKQLEDLSFQAAELYDVIYESYRNVAGLFNAAEEAVRNEIKYYLENPSSFNEYGIDINNPYKGLFLRDGKTFDYTINHSRKTAYSLNKTKIYYQNGRRCRNIDPLPAFMGYGRSLGPGIWLGDIIGVDDVLPVGYELITEIRLDW